MRSMSSDHVAVALVHTVKSTCSQSNHSNFSNELNSHADTCVVGSNILVVHNHEHFVGVYGFDKETMHSNACTIDVTITDKRPCHALNLDPYDQPGYQDQ